MKRFRKDPHGRCELCTPITYARFVRERLISVVWIHRCRRDMDHVTHLY